MGFHTDSLMVPTKLYDVVRYHVVPPVFLVFFTGIVQVLAQFGRGDAFNFLALLSPALGNLYSWTFVGTVLAWAYLGLRIPAKRTHGPPTDDGYIPEYRDNGMLYYLVTMGTYLVAQIVWPSLSLDIYNNFPEILGTFNLMALVLCTYLYLTGRPDANARCLPRLYLFYRGVDLHPRILGVDVKQFTNCRVGLMLWQVFVLAFYIAGLQSHGFNMGCLVTTVLQTIYLAKFYYWEAGYFHTLDIILDRAGYYICWGCLVWVPCFYTFTSYFLVAHKPLLTEVFSTLIGVAGILSIFINYRIDAEKQTFRSAPEGKCNIWGRPATFIRAKYKDSKGNVRTSLLLTSGFWGITRHMNYTFELILSLCWCLPGLGYGPSPFLYFFFLLYLLIHRCFRDEEKCSVKYGKYWSEYCANVPYRLIPYIF